MDVFPRISKWMMWKIGNHKKIKIGEDQRSRADEDYMLSDDLLEFPHDQGIFSLWNSKVKGHGKFRRPC